MGVLRSVIEVLLLGKLADGEEQDGAEDDTLVQGVANHVQGLVVDSVHLLQSLQVVLAAGRVRDCPQAQLVHVAQGGPVDLEGNAEAFLLGVAQLVVERALADVVHVAGRALQVLSGRPQVRKLVHFPII